MYEYILNLDLSILDSMEFMRNSFFDPFMLFLSYLGDNGLLWITAGVVFLLFSKTRRLGVCLLFSLLINLVIVNISIKPLVARMRPFEYVKDISLLIPKPTDYSFPSGHTSSSFAAATSVFLHSRKLSLIAFALACLIGFSRLYLYVHFPTDVFCGALFGIFSSLIAYKILNICYNAKKLRHK